MPTLPAAELEAFAKELLAAAGAPAETARLVAASLVCANVLGVDSHGVVRLVQYVDEIEAGAIDPAAAPEVSVRGPFVVVEGRGGFGQLVAAKAAAALAQLALEKGLAAAAVSGVRHVGRVGEYVEPLAREGLVGLAFCNTGPPGGRVAPFGGAQAFFATNPVAYALPATEAPVVADFATSVVAEGRVRLARQRGERVPDGWLVDAAGRASDEPAALYEGGALLCAGGHKGSALALLCELLGGGLTGAGTASTGADPGNGLVVLALNPGALPCAGRFQASVDEVVDALRRVPPVAGVDRVRAPGDLERETAEQRRTTGVPIAEETWGEILDVARRLGAGVAARRTRAPRAARAGPRAGRRHAR